MRVALVNSNPVVSRLVTLSLDKIGYDYVEAENFDGLDGKSDFDILVLDSEVEIADYDIKSVANRILFLASKSSTVPDMVDNSLLKPFLPTEFISIIEALAASVMPKEEAIKLDNENLVINKDLNQDDNKDDKFFSDAVDGLFEEIKFDLEDGLDTDGLEHTTLSDDKAKRTDIDEISDLVSEIDELPSQTDDNDLTQAQASVSEIDTQSIKEDTKIRDLEELVKSIDEPIEELEDKSKDVEDLGDVKFSDENLEPVSNIINSDELPSQDELWSEITNEELTNKSDIDWGLDENPNQVEIVSDEISDEDLEAKINADMDNVDGLEFDDKTLETDDLANTDELVINEGVNADEQDEIERLTTQLDNKISDELLDDENLDIENADELTEDEVANKDDNNVSNDQVSMELKDIETNKALKNEENLEMDDEKMGIVEDLESLNERDLKIALDESVDDLPTNSEDEKQVLDTTDDNLTDDISSQDKQSFEFNDIKEEISAKITEQITSVLSDSELKTALKNLNIKINISFEEK